ncbi:SurA N-terminal domain-containing protein [candidate division KSB1 bacterium]
MTENIPQKEFSGIMNKMREKMHYILYILVVCFVGLIVVEWGMDITGIRSPSDQGIVGKVNGTEISQQDFFQMQQQQWAAIRDQTGSAPDESYMRLIRDQIFNSMVNEILIREAVSKLDLQASDKEIFQEVRYRPIPDILNSPDFRKEDGTFDEAKYESLLSQMIQTNDPSLLYLEENARYQIPRTKLIQLVSNSVFVTEEEVKRAYVENELKASADYILAEPSRFSDVQIDITEDEISDYYKENKDMFFENETRQLKYVLFDTNPTAADSQSVLTRIQDALQRAKDGEDFSGLAQEYTDSDGDLGTFAKGAMTADFENAVFAPGVKQNDIIGPIETSFGNHIVKIERVVKTRNGEIDSIQARQILLSFEASANTIETSENKAKYFARIAEDQGYESTAQQEGLTVLGTMPFIRYGFIPGFGSNADIDYFAFTSEFSGNNSPISPVIETPLGFAVFQLSAVNEEHTKPVTDPTVRSTIEMALIEQKQMELAESMMSRISEEIKGGVSFEDAAEKDNLEIKTVESFGVNDYLTDVGYDVNFTSAAFSLDASNISDPVKGDKGVYLIKLTQKDQFDVEKYTEKRSETAMMIIQQKKNVAWSMWIQNLRDNADIEDFRDQMY